MLPQMQNQSTSLCISLQDAHFIRQNSYRTALGSNASHLACSHPEKIESVASSRPGHFFSGPGVDSRPVPPGPKHRRDEMRRGKKPGKCNHRDYTFCQVGNLKIRQKSPNWVTPFLTPEF